MHFFLFAWKKSSFPRDSYRYCVSRIGACFTIKLKHRRQRRGSKRNWVLGYIPEGGSTKEMLKLTLLNAYFPEPIHIFII